MVTQFIHSALSATTYESTDLNSLPDDGVVLGDAINNSSNRDMMLKVEIYLASVDLSSQTDPHVQVRLLESIDGSNYEDNDDKAWAISLPVDPGTGAATHRRMGDLYIPPGYFKLAIVNKTGAAFASSGNTLKYAPYTPETDS